MLAFGYVSCLGVVVGTGFLVSVESENCVLFSFSRVFNCKNLHSENNRKPEGSEQLDSTKIYK